MDINDENIRDYVTNYLRDMDGSIKYWDVSKVTDMSNLFSDTDFNESLEWNAISVTTMNNMFKNCKKLNSPLTIFAPNIKDMSFMFSGCTLFNSPVIITLYDELRTSLSFDMNNIFHECIYFNQSFQINEKTNDIPPSQNALIHFQNINNILTVVYKSSKLTGI